MNAQITPNGITPEMPPETCEQLLDFFRNAAPNAWLLCDISWTRKT
jgi:hypothetical protein